MFIVYYKNDLQNGKIIRPTPFVSISYDALRNKQQAFGGSYSITLTGSILANAGSPINDKKDATDLIDNIKAIGPNYEDNPAGNYTRVAKQNIDYEDRAYSMFLKQQALRALFAHDGQKMEYSSIRNDEAIISFYPTVDSISFEEGVYTDICRYTINLTAPMIFDDFGRTILDIDSQFAYHVEDYSDTWAIEVDEGVGRTPNVIPPNASISKTIPRGYRVTRSVSATGKTIYNQGKRYEAWEQARNFVKTNILKETLQQLPTNQIGFFPGYLETNTFGSGLLEIPNGFGAYNHIRSENIDKTNGTYSLSDTWILSPESATESYNISVSSSNSSPLVSVSIDGSIKGLSGNTANNFVNNNRYNNAYQKFQTISGDFGVNSTLYKRANNVTAVVLNTIPANFSMTKNELVGEINYNITYDNRPSNFFPNVSKENITINDTYPGDVYSIIPVINSLNGPIFQYIGGRTEYRRDLTIELTVDRGSMGNNKMVSKNSYIYRKPSNNPQIKDTLTTIINRCSPASEPTIRKYFLNPTSENWDPKTGNYSVQISWTYELNS